MTAFLTRYTVFHVHWPEQLAAGASRAQTICRLALFHLLLTKLKLNKTPIIWTVHNVRPHENMHPLVSSTLRRFEHQVSRRVVLNRATAFDPTFGSHTYSVIPHGHYLPTVDAAGEISPDPASDFLFFGLIRQYKNVSGLMHAFNEIDNPHVSLRIAGSAQPVAHGVNLAEIAARDTRINITLDFLSDNELVGLIRAATLVVLPYNEMNNSGAALLALSVGRPILVPENEATRELHQEFGSRWISLYSGALTRGVLEDALHSAREARIVSSPDLSSRNWDGIAIQHHDLYASVSDRVPVKTQRKQDTNG